MTKALAVDEAKHGVRVNRCGFLFSFHSQLNEVFVFKCFFNHFLVNGLLKIFPSVVPCPWLRF